MSTISRSASFQSILKFFTNVNISSVTVGIPFIDSILLSDLGHKSLLYDPIRKTLNLHVAYI